MPPSASQAVSILTIGVPVEDLLTEGSHIQESWPSRAVVRQRTLGPDEVRDTCQEIARAAEQGGRPPSLEQVLPSRPSKELMRESAVDGLDTLIGLGPDGEPVRVMLAGANSHVLILGATGMGKTSIIKTMATKWGTLYPPEELTLKVLDGKTADLAGMAPGPKHESWLPQAGVVGLNMEDDPEFSNAIVSSVEDEMRRRANLFRQNGVTNYEDFRRANLDAKLPREVLLLDEFQVFLEGGKDGAEMAAMLNRIARKGRSFGVHLILSTQNIGAIKTLWNGDGKVIIQQAGVKLIGRNGSFFDDNDIGAKPQELPVMHVALKDATGRKMTVRVPAAFENVVAPRREQIWREALARNRNLQPPRLFDGDIVPQWSASPAYRKLKDGSKKDQPSTPVAVIGEASSLKSESAVFKLTKESGRNLAVIGPRPDEACRILETAAESLAMQLPPEKAAFVLFCLNEDMMPEATRNAEKLRQKGHAVSVVGPDDAALHLARISDQLESTPKGHRRLVFVYGANMGGSSMNKKQTVDLGNAEACTLETKFGKVEADAVIGTAEDGSPLKAPYSGTIEVKQGRVRLTLENSGRGYLTNIAANGPEEGATVFATWPNPDIMRESLGPNEIKHFRGYVALGIHGTKLASMTPGVIGADSQGAATRVNRGRFYDQDDPDRNGRPRVIVPYAIRPPES